MDDQNQNATSSNSLISVSKASDSHLQVQLHPLVILNISDYITRHTLRRQPGPIAGAILGAQNGREITMEHAFECKLDTGPNGEILFDPIWFHARLQQYKDVHKAPALDLVAWFTLTPLSGPQLHHLPIHQQLINNYNESILLLAFHPSAVDESSSRGGKLPLTIYETVYEAPVEPEDADMQSSGIGPQHVLRFQELPYTIETGEAEMISVDFVARGGANAAAADDTNSAAIVAKSQATKQPNGTQADDPAASALSPEDEDLIASLTAKANATRMLHQRVRLLRAYVASLPDCYLTRPPPTDGSSVSVSPHPQISHPILRSIAALLARLPLLTPDAAHETEAMQERADVALVGLVAGMGRTLRDAQEMGRKASLVEHARGVMTRRAGAGDAGGLDEVPMELQ